MGCRDLTMDKKAKGKEKVVENNDEDEDEALQEVEEDKGMGPS